MSQCGGVKDCHIEDGAELVYVATEGQTRMDGLKLNKEFLAQY